MFTPAHATPFSELMEVVLATRHGARCDQSPVFSLGAGAEPGCEASIASTVLRAHLDALAEAAPPPPPRPANQGTLLKVLGAGPTVGDSIAEAFSGGAAGLDSALSDGRPHRSPPPQKRDGVVGKMTVADVAASGPVEAPQLRKVLGRRLGSFRTCYQRALQKDPTLTGAVSLDVTIGTNGRVTSAKATGEPEVVARCLAIKVKRIRFFVAAAEKTTLKFSLVMSVARRPSP